MDLNEIYQPIKQDLVAVERVLSVSLKKSGHKSTLGISSYLLDAKGKRLRPALVILSAKAGLNLKSPNYQFVKIAAAIELIHMASLIHDDVIDHASTRHNKPTVNAKWGSDVSIALGDYLYSIAFELISKCRDGDILECISSAMKSMCEGELVQVLERDNLDLLKERYIVMVKKKTAALFAASCQAGSIVSEVQKPVQSALKEYGLNFGIAFQIVDDCLDLIGKARHLGKSPGADFKMGELTLPVLNLVSCSPDKNRIMSLLRQPQRKEAFNEIRRSFINSNALRKTKKDISFYIQKAKENLKICCDCEYRSSLEGLADFVNERIGL